ncbi:MAG: hypothetical protein V4582_11130 [Pseudomonadota bacterium]
MNTKIAAAAAASAPTAALAPSAQRPCRVLLVGTDGGDELALLRALWQTGLVTARTVSKPLDALRLLAEPGISFDIAICKAEMIGMDGADFLRFGAMFDVGQFVLVAAPGSVSLPEAEALMHGYGAPTLRVLEAPIDPHSLVQLLRAYCIGIGVGAAGAHHDARA